MEPERHVGRRVREIRTYRGLTLTALAGLAGMSQANLSRIEHGQQGVSRKRTLERLAAALRVAPSELTGAPFAATGDEPQQQAAIDRLRAVLRDIELGMVDSDLGAADVDGLGALAAEIDNLTARSAACEYGAVGDLAPGLIARAHLVAGSGSATGDLLFVRALKPAFNMCSVLGEPDVKWTVARMMHAAAVVVGDPAWIGVAEWHRAHALVGADSRLRALTLVQRAADETEPGPGSAGEAYGLLRLSAALHSILIGDTSAVADLVAEADDVARHTGEGNFAGMNFGPRNVGVWRVALAVEMGEMDRVPELARGVDVDAIPSAGRRGAFYSDLGRGLAARLGNDGAAIEALLRAERIAPQLVRGNPYVREATTDLLRRARPDAEGRELRGLAYRIGAGA